MQNIHSIAVAVNGKAVLIKGQSGSGKSSLALQLILLGGKLIADDQTEVFLEQKKVFLRAPVSLPNGLEIRGVGIVKAPLCKKAELKFVIDLSQCEKERLPNLSTQGINILGYSFPFYFFQDIKNPAHAIYALLEFGLLEV